MNHPPIAGHYFEYCTCSLKECIKYLQGLSSDVKSFYSEVCTLTELPLAIPGTNALSKFSVIRQVKYYLRSTIHH